MPKLKSAGELLVGAVEHFIGEKLSESQCSWQPLSQNSLVDAQALAAVNEQNAQCDPELFKDRTPLRHPAEK